MTAVVRTATGIHGLVVLTVPRAGEAHGDDARGILEVHVTGVGLATRGTQRACRSLAAAPSSGSRREEVELSGGLVHRSGLTEEFVYLTSFERPAE